jgi:hypothetical protein
MIDADREAATLLCRSASTSVRRGCHRQRLKVELLGQLRQSGEVPVLDVDRFLFQGRDTAD